MRLLPSLAIGCIALVGCASPTPQPFSVPAASSPASGPADVTPEEIELYGPRVERPDGLLKKPVPPTVEECRWTRCSAPATSGIAPPGE